MRLCIERYRSILVASLLIVLCLLLAACSGEQLGDGGAQSAVGTGGFVTGNTAITTPEESTTKPQLEIVAPTTDVAQTTSKPSIEIVVPTETTAVVTSPDLSIGGSHEDIYADSPNTLRVDFLNTGKSDAMILRMDGKVILIDTGDSNDYKKISDYLDGYGIHTVDAMIITHFDNDHVGAASRIVEDYSVKKVYAPDYIRNSSNYRSLMAAVADEENTSLITVSDDLALDMGYGSIWINPTRLYPGGLTVGSDASNEFSEENNYSLIVTVDFGKARLMITGDAERERMEEFSQVLSERGESLDYTLVKMPHHGSYTKGIDEIIRAVTPRYCVVCADGEATVESDTVILMRGQGAAAYYTYNGDVHFISNGTSSTIVTD